MESDKGATGEELGRMRKGGGEVQVVDEKVMEV